SGYELRLCIDCVFFFFFFQAEDGIRDKLVTGVQTCALPILIPVDADLLRLCGYYLAEGYLGRETGRADAVRARVGFCFHEQEARSEERRVGKECRGRWGAEDLKKKEEKR